jgi:uncharacterized membrane protein
MPFGCLSISLIFGMLLLLPFILADAVMLALAKLGLSPGISLLAVLGIIMGGLINIPVKEVKVRQQTPAIPVRLFGIEYLFPGALAPPRQYAIIAINLGGCLIPSFIAVYELLRIASHGTEALVLATLAISLNIAVCYRFARSVPGVGIAMRPFIPALVAALSAIILMPDFAPPLAFTAGVIGPLVGADLLHLDHMSRDTPGVASIGGAGTFDGIVLSGLVATLLA